MLLVGAELFHPDVRRYVTKLRAKAPAQKRSTVSTQCTGRSVRLVQNTASIACTRLTGRSFSRAWTVPCEVRGEHIYQKEHV